MPFCSNFAANEAIESDQESDHDFVIAGFFGVFEQVLYDGLMAGAVEWLRNVGEQLLTRPGSRVFLPAIGERGESFGLIGFADSFEKRGILGGKVFFCQQHLTAVRLGRSHGLCGRDENARKNSSRKKIQTRANGDRR